MTIMSNTPSDRSSAHLRPLWPPPRSPLSPHRLAKLANALGVSTPLPATHYPANATPSSSSASFSDSMFRSPTPSATSTHNFSPHLTSKYLLHVIPPTHLNYATNADHFDLISSPASTSGYHSQHRRGTLVPLHSTLQSQLLAIAKEYALPSTVGIVLYLVSSTPGRESVNPTPNSDASRLEWENEEPGPRLSDVVWKHIWTRVLKVEKDDALSFLSRTGTPDPAYPASLSSPSLLLDSTTLSHSLRPLISHQTLETATSPAMNYPITPSPSTPSSFDLHMRSQSKSKQFGSRSVSTPIDPDMSPSVSSVSLDPNADSLELPGLTSPSLIPVLAKVEFDIDRRKAAWYEPWLRSRRRNHAKRPENRARGVSESSGNLNEDEEKRPPIGLRLVGRLQAERRTPEFLREREEGYSQLDEDEDEEEITAQFPAVPGGKDPLADMFGTDADTWAEMRADRPPNGARLLRNPNIVDLALDGPTLSTMQPEGGEEPRHLHDEDEVRALWDEHSRPRLSLSIPTSSRNRMSSSGSANSKKHIPPPLNITVASPTSGLLVPQEDLSPMPSSGEESVGLVYLKSTPSDGSSIQVSGSTLAESDVKGETIKKNPVGLGIEDKRGGAFFDDLDLGLADSYEYDDEHYDESDPYDRRKSQYLLKAKLDEIEKALVQFSPRALRTGFPESPTKPAKLPARSSVSSSSTLLGPGGLSPSKSSLKANRERDTSEIGAGAEDAVWPAVPYSVLNTSGPENSPPTSYYEDLSPPTWTLNGVSSVPPKSPYTGKRPPNVISEETKARQKYETENLYPPLQPPRVLGSPIIPLSPDPFGRYPSGFDSQTGYNSVSREPEPVSQRPSAASNPPLIGLNRQDTPAPSSRFSIDSTVSEEADAPSQKNPQQRGSSLVSVKNIRKLWRKSNKASLSVAPPLPNSASGKTSPQLIPSVPANRDLFAPPRSPSFSEMPPPPTPSLPPSRAPSRAESSTDYLRFDQELKYSIHPNGISPPTKPVALALAPSNGRTPSPSAASPLLPTADKNGSVRKSILKSWKSTSGSISQMPESIRSTSDHRSTESIFANNTRKRRPSIFDPASSFVRGSTVSEYPPTPTLPDQYSNAPVPQVMKPNRSSLRSRPPPAGSYSSTESSSPSVISPVSNSSPPRQGTAAVRLASRESFESRSSWDNSQFEILAPKLDKHGMRSSLSYPYHELDHQE